MKKLTIATLVALMSTSTANALEEDRFADIRKPWIQCAACHGVKGLGGIGPRIDDKSADYIIDRLLQYKRGEMVGSQSGLMYPQAQALTEGQIGTIGVFVQEGFPNK